MARLFWRGNIPKKNWEIATARLFWRGNIPKKKLVKSQRDKLVTKKVTCGQSHIRFFKILDWILYPKDRGGVFMQAPWLKLTKRTPKNDKYTGFGGIPVCGLQLVSLFDFVFEGVVRFWQWPGNKQPKGFEAGLAWLLRRQSAKVITIPTWRIKIPHSIQSDHWFGGRIFDGQYEFRHWGQESKINSTPDVPNRTLTWILPIPESVPDRLQSTRIIVTYLTPGKWCIEDTA